MVLLVADLGVESCNVTEHCANDTYCCLQHTGGPFPYCYSKPVAGGICTQAGVYHGCKCPEGYKCTSNGVDSTGICTFVYNATSSIFCNGDMCDLNSRCCIQDKYNITICAARPAIGEICISNITNPSYCPCLAPSVCADKYYGFICE